MRHNHSYGVNIFSRETVLFLMEFESSLPPPSYNIIHLHRLKHRTLHFVNIYFNITLISSPVSSKRYLRFPTKVGAHFSGITLSLHTSHNSKFRISSP